MRILTVAPNTHTWFHGRYLIVEVYTQPSAFLIIFTFLFWMEGVFKWYLIRVTCTLPNTPVSHAPQHTINVYMVSFEMSSLYPTSWDIIVVKWFSLLNTTKPESVCIHYQETLYWQCKKLHRWKKQKSYLTLPSTMWWRSLSCHLEVSHFLLLPERGNFSIFIRADFMVTVQTTLLYGIPWHHPNRPRISWLTKINSRWLVLGYCGC